MNECVNIINEWGGGKGGRGASSRSDQGKKKKTEKKENLLKKYIHSLI